jgi:hypothetical protein
MESKQMKEAREKLMSDAEYARTHLGLLKKILRTTVLVGLFGIVFLGAGVCQTPGYGERPDRWAPYEQGKYFEQLQKIVSIYHFDGSKITYIHFELADVGVGPVELFRIPVVPNEVCSENDCYFYVLVASDHGDAPLMTPCQFKQAALTHLFNPDGSRFFYFEFSCQDTLLQVKVTPTHLMAISIKKDAAKMESK